MPSLVTRSMMSCSSTAFSELSWKVNPAVDSSELTDSRDFGGNLDALASQFRLYLPARRGHGHTADIEGLLTLELMAQDTVVFLETVVRHTAHLVGYSAGATVALRVAVATPNLVDKLVVISGTFKRTG